jgi:hypothetical protein
MRGVLLALCLAACSRTYPPDGWYAAPPDGVTADPVDRALVEKAANETTAEATLASHSWVAVDQIKDIQTSSLVAPPGSQIYLVRGLVLAGTEQTGSFSVSQLATGEVRVHWGCLGSGSYPSKRQAIVVALPHAPTAVYVTTSIAR